MYICVSCDMLVKKGGYVGMRRLTTGWKTTIGERTETGQVNRERISTGLTMELRMGIICVSCDMLRRSRDEEHPKPGIYKTDL